MFIFKMPKEIVYHMMRGRAIFVIPENQALTTQDAANILGVSRPYLVNLLDNKVMESFKVGRYRRVRASEIMKYKLERERKQEALLDELSQLSQEYGLYD